MASIPDLSHPVLPLPVVLRIAIFSEKRLLGLRLVALTECQICPEVSLATCFGHKINKFIYGKQRDVTKSAEISFNTHKVVSIFDIGTIQINVCSYEITEKKYNTNQAPSILA